MKQLLSRHLSKLSMLPVIISLTFIGTSLIQSIDKLQEAYNTIHQVEEAKLTNALVHELQKERGMTAGFIGSQGVSFKQELVSQRQLVNDRLEALRQFKEQVSLGSESQIELDKLFSQLLSLDTIRSRVDRLSIPLSEALSYYTAANTILLNLNGKLSLSSTELIISQELSSLYNIANAKEQSGIERAILNNAFAQKSLPHRLINVLLAF